MRPGALEQRRESPSCQAPVAVARPAAEPKPRKPPAAALARPLSWAHPRARRLRRRRFRSLTGAGSLVASPSVLEDQGPGYTGHFSIRARASRIP